MLQEELDSSGEMMGRMDFAQKSLILITGASRGIGQKIAIELSKRVMPSSTFILLARTAEGLEKTKSEIAKVNQSIGVHTCQIDLSKPDLAEYNELLEDILAKTNIIGTRVACIVHNAGHVGMLSETTQLTDLQSWRTFFDFNVFSAFLLNGVFLRKLQPLIQHMIVINITSLIGRVPYENMSMYGAAKAARDNFFHALALEQHQKVSVLSYSPGPVLTDLLDWICDNAEVESLRSVFKKTRDESAITTDQTVGRLMDILSRGFKNGAIIDYFDKLD